MQAHGNDPEKAKEARAVIARLYGIDPSEFSRDYEVTVSVDTPNHSISEAGSKPLRIGIAQIGTNLMGSAQLAIRGDLVTMYELTASGWRSPTREEIETKVKADVAAASGTLFGEPRALRSGAQAVVGPFKFPTGLLEHTVATPPQNGGPIHGAFMNGANVYRMPGFKSGLERNRESIALYNSQISSAILSAFSAIPTLPTDHRSIKQAWDFERGPFLLVVIDEESWKAYKGGIVIRYSLHAAGKPEETYRRTPIKEIPAGRFTAHDSYEAQTLNADRLSPDAGGKMQVRWGTANMIGESATPAFRDELVTQMEIYGALRAKAQDEGKPIWQFW
jgi:hypothetical protein